MAIIASWTDSASYKHQIIQTNKSNIHKSNIHSNLRLTLTYCDEEADIFYEGLLNSIKENPTHFTGT